MSDPSSVIDDTPFVPVPDHRRRQITHYTLLMTILALAAFLRFYCLSCSSLWHDEGNTWALIGRSFSQIGRDTGADIHPPGYYWLLKVWTSLFGRDVVGLRSFSATAGTATVFLIYAVGRRIWHGRSLSDGWLPLLAAFLAAVNPFQIFYSQEARMYALLALESTALFWALFSLIDGGVDAQKRWGATGDDLRSSTVIRIPAFVYLLAAIMGFWTHYIFPLLLAAAGLAYLWHWWRCRHSPYAARNQRRLVLFLAINGLALFAFAPWLPTAMARLLAWPAGGETVSLADGVRLSLKTLLVGPIRSATNLAWPWAMLAGLLPIVGLWRLRTRDAGVALALWLLAPILLMFALGLFTQAFLKFLLVASPAWCLLTAALSTGAGGVDRRTDKGIHAHGPAPPHAPREPRRTGRVSSILSGILLSLCALVLGLLVLPAYYTDAAARDNYAGIARTVAALGDPATDLVLLNAPGQQEVWAYYDPGLPVLALPHQRPPDPAQTESLLTGQTADRRQIFALFWALDESDPQGIVEDWLDRNGYKGLESWQGNVRFVTYTLPNQLACVKMSPLVSLGAFVTLQAVCRDPVQTTYFAGESIPVGLEWRPERRVDQQYKVTLQLLDARNQVIAQQDSEPVAGAQPTNSWQPGDVIVDNHALFLPPGTPPGRYRLVVALYHNETGARLSVRQGSQELGDTFVVGDVVVVHPDRPLPASSASMMKRVNQRAGPVLLVGYDLHRRGYDHAPETPLSAGDQLHVTLYWQAPDILPDTWPADLQMTLRLGNEAITAPLAGGGYPTGAWQKSDLVRGEFDLLYAGNDPWVWLEVANRRLRLGRVP